MSVPVPTTNPITSRRSVRGGLSRTILLILLSVSMVPILIIGGVTYYRSRVMLRDQATSQLRTIVGDQAKKIDDGIIARQTALDQLMKGSYSNAISSVLIDKKDSREYIDNNRLLQQGFFSALTKDQQPFFNQLILLDPKGKVVLSTRSDWLGRNFGTEEWLKLQLGYEHSVLVYSPMPDYENQVVELTVRMYYNSTTKATGTLVGFTSEELFRNALAGMSGFYPSARAYLFTLTNRAFMVDPNRAPLTPLAELTLKQDQLSAIEGVNNGSNLEIIGEYVTTDNVPVLVFGQHLQVSGLSLVEEIPSQVVYQQVGSLILFTVIMIVIMLVIVGFIAWSSARSLVEPLSQLSESTLNFAQGDWSERSPIQRRDEIGVLASSFNQMADELTRLYRSLESQVAERTSQLRTANEVAQVATSAVSLNEILHRTVNLVIERFGYFHASIFLIDTVGEYAVLRESTGDIGEQLKNKGYRIAIGSSSIIGWVSAHNQPRLVGNVREDPLYLQEDLLSGTRSEVAVPISIGSRTLGVLDVQSQDVQAFDNDTVTVLQTLANHIASAIQNVRLLESAEVNLQETSLLYHASQQISQAATEQGAYEIVIQALEQTASGSAILVLENDHFSVQSAFNTEGKGSITLPDVIPMPSLGLETYLSPNNPTLIRDVYQAPSGMFGILSIPRKLNHTSAVFVPVRVRGEVCAFLLFSSPEHGVLTETRIQPYTNLGEMLGTTLEKIQALRTIELHLNQLQQLNQVSQAISQETDLPGLYRSLHGQIRELFGDVYFMIAQYDSKKEMIEFPYVYESGDPVSLDPYPLGDGLTSYLIRTSKPLMLVKDTEDQARALGAKVIGKPAKSWLGVPLMVASHSIGAMILQDVEHEGRFTDDDLNFISTLVPQISTTIRNVQLLNDTRSALKAFEQERFLLNTLLQNVPDQIFFKDRESHFLRVSRSVATRFGLNDPAQMIGKSDFNFLPEEQARQLYQEEQDLIQGGEPQIGLIEKETSAAGGDRWVLSTRLPLHDADQQVVGLFGISRDITDLKGSQDLAQKRAQQLRTAAEIARDTSGTLILEELLGKVVNLVRDRFNFYHASIFLIDPGGEFAELRESTGEAGRQMMEAGHKLAVGSQSVVGQATHQGEPLVVNDVTKDPTHLPNPLLPDTRAEMAIPLKIANRIIGALDVQSTQKQAFAAEDVSILQVLADQLAIAVVNANLFAETQENLAQHRLLHQITTAAASSSTMEDSLTSAVEGLRVALGGDSVSILLKVPGKDLLQPKAWAGYEGQDIGKLVISFDQGITGWVANQRQPLAVNNPGNDPRYLSVSQSIKSELAVPLIYRDELLGVLNLESDRSMAYDENDQEVLGTLGGSLAAIIANSRLIEQIRRQMDRQQQLFEATSKIRRSVDMQKILQTSVTEIGKVVGVRSAKIEILTPGGQAPEQPLKGKSNGKEKRP